MEMKRFYFFILLLLTAVIITARLLTPPDAPTTGDTAIPADTSAVLYAVHDSYDSLFIGTPRSETYFYDADGNIITCICADKLYGNIITPYPDGLCFFQRDHAVLADTAGSTTIPYPGGSNITGVDTSGYIDEFGLLYAILHDTRSSADTPYTTILRLISADGAYDVAIPYYLDTVCYDAETRRFIGIINGYFSDIPSGSDLAYVTVDFDTAAQCFVLSPGLHAIDDPYLTGTDDGATGIGYIAGDGLLHAAVTFPNDPNDPTGIGSLLLHTYDIAADQFVSRSTLLADYRLGVYGGIFIGRPTITANGRLYLFTANDKAVIISDAQDITTIDLPHELLYAEGMSIGSSLGTLTANINVGTDGSIYILCPYVADGSLQIYRVQTDAGYKLIWQGTAPRLSRHMQISDFILLP
ncbi:MAG: hypothetical protein IJB55_05935 [Firmicutes bacterium]|nr:hypothetical protein [Bacillota bacterium]